MSRDGDGVGILQNLFSSMSCRVIDTMRNDNPDKLAKMRSSVLHMGR